jgi:hypothetical protein
MVGVCGVFGVEEWRRVINDLCDVNSEDYQLPV